MASGAPRGPAAVGHGVPAIEAIVFDTFGTVVDWRGSIARDLQAWGDGLGIHADWPALADAWRARYQPQMDRVRRGEIPWTPLDALHLDALHALLPGFGLAQLDDGQRLHVNRVWHRLDGWPDAVAGLTRLKARHVIGPLSNGNVALLVHLARHAGLPWDAIFSAELFQRYKPHPDTYLGTCRLLALAPQAVMLCAAHNDDLQAARAAGLRTAFVARPTEYGPAQATDLAAAEDWDIVATDLNDLARQLGA